MTQTTAQPTARDRWQDVARVLRRIRDWPDPDNPYSPYLTVLVPSLFILAVLAFR